MKENTLTDSCPILFDRLRKEANTFVNNRLKTLMSERDVFGAIHNLAATRNRSLCGSRHEQLLQGLELICHRIASEKRKAQRRSPVYDLNRHIAFLQTRHSIEALLETAG